MALPLLFSFQQPVFGNGFLAGVRMYGRALLEEGDETWISGVAPVGFAAGGADRGAAFTAFRNAWVTVLFDIASESHSFEAFKQACTEFLNSTTPGFTAEWDAALAEVRRTQYVDPTLKREQSDHEVTFDVVELTQQQHDSSENVLEVGLLTAA